MRLELSVHPSRDEGLFQQGTEAIYATASAAAMAGGKPISPGPSFDVPPTLIYWLLNVRYPLRREPALGVCFRRIGTGNGLHQG